MKLDHPTPAQLPELKRLWRDAFGDEAAFIEAFFETAYAPENCRCITEEGTLAAMAYWLEGAYWGQKIAYLYAVATRSDFRGQGLCQKLLEDIHSLLKNRGYAAAMLRPGSEGLRRMYGKMGYADCCTAAEFSCEAGEKLPIREISPEEYGALRRKFLPMDGVIQEGESLAFLGRIAKLYAGADFLLAANVEGELLHGAELLGNREAAPGIAAALGCDRGEFRTPGGEAPFAMICPLTENAEIPGYLGLVFD